MALISNVPNDKFSGDYGDMWVACFNWVVILRRVQCTTTLLSFFDCAFRNER